MHHGISLDFACAEAMPGGAGARSVDLPHTTGAWTRREQGQAVSAANIFHYMSGAGELYIGYRFHRLDVYNYVSPDQDEILVEIYWMASCDDAFGLLSNDWGGDIVDVGTHKSGSAASFRAPDHRALYGAGLLRVWSDNIYARVMAYRESEESKRAVLEIARSIVRGGKSPSPPALLGMLPENIDASFQPRLDRLCFFRSHLVLNSIYFLSTRNILNLGLPVEAVTTSYEASAAHGNRLSLRVVLIRYPGAPEARAALSHFSGVYLPELVKGDGAKPFADSDILKIEDGWIGYHLKGRFLGLVFECPSPEVARSFVNQLSKSTHKVEAVHE